MQTTDIKHKVKKVLKKIFNKDTLVKFIIGFAGLCLLATSILPYLL